MVAIVGAVFIGESLEAAAIAFLFSLAELLERSAVVRARDSIDQLLRLSPDQATLVEAGTGVVSLMVAVLVGDLGASFAVTLNAMRIARMKPKPPG